jgi:hypothetical protein
MPPLSVGEMMKMPISCAAAAFTAWVEALQSAGIIDNYPTRHREFDMIMLMTA